MSQTTTTNRSIRRRRRSRKQQTEHCIIANEIGSDHLVGKITSSLFEGSGGIWAFLIGVEMNLDPNHFKQMITALTQLRNEISEENTQPSDSTSDTLDRMKQIIDYWEYLLKTMKKKMPTPQQVSEDSFIVKMNSSFFEGYGITSFLSGYHGQWHDPSDFKQMIIALIQLRNEKKEEYDHATQLSLTKGPISVG